MSLCITGAHASVMSGQSAWQAPTDLQCTIHRQIRAACAFGALWGQRHGGQPDMSSAEPGGDSDQCSCSTSSGASSGTSSDSGPSSGTSC
jgi:hypothetical protein